MGLSPLDLEHRLDSLAAILDELADAYRELGVPLARVVGAELRTLTTGQLHQILVRAMDLAARAQQAATTARAIHRVMVQDPNR
jgi:hypothetical protein